jgi:hypothetical protein
MHKLHTRYKGYRSIAAWGELLLWRLLHGRAAAKKRGRERGSVRLTRMFRPPVTVVSTEKENDVNGPLV